MQAVPHPALPAVARVGLRVDPLRDGSIFDRRPTGDGGAETSGARYVCACVCACVRECEHWKLERAEAHAGCASSPKECLLAALAPGPGTCRVGLAQRPGSHSLTHAFLLTVLPRKKNSAPTSSAGVVAAAAAAAPAPLPPPPPQPAPPFLPDRAALAHRIRANFESLMRDSPQVAAKVSMTGRL
jgi:hypothetical protein